jgi:hypothetical protein
MNNIPNEDKPGFVAEKPEHCFACYRVLAECTHQFNTILERRVLGGDNDSAFRGTISTAAHRARAGQRDISSRKPIAL